MPPCWRPVKDLVNQSDGFVFFGFLCFLVHFVFIICFFFGLPTVVLQKGLFPFFVNATKCAGWCFFGS